MDSYMRIQVETADNVLLSDRMPIRLCYFDDYGSRNGINIFIRRTTNI